MQGVPCARQLQDSAILHSLAAEGLCHPELPGNSALQDLYPAPLHSLLMQAVLMHAVLRQRCTMLHRPALQPAHAS